MLFCGIDIGSTNLKVGLTDGAGRLRHAEIVPTPRGRDDLGVVTDPLLLLQKVEDLVLQVWRKAGADQAITAICTTGVGEDGLLLDADLHPLGAVIPWFDRRASTDADHIRGTAATPRAGIAMDPTRTGAKWRWLAHHRAEAMDRARVWVALTDYPLIAWGARPFISETLAARTGCYDPFAREWIADLLGACDAPPLPPIIQAGRIAGWMRCPRLIAAGAATTDTLLVAGGHDHPIAASVILRDAPSARIDSLGTASVLYAEAPAFTPTAHDPLIAYAVPVRGGPGVACMGVLEFAEALGATGTPPEIRDFLSAQPLPGKPGLPQPIIAGQPDPRGIRAVLEAAAMTTRAMLDRMADLGAPPGPLYATGGWSRSDGLLQLRASVLGQTILTMDAPELALIGAALLAAEAAGVAAGFHPAPRAITPLGAWRKEYDAAYPVFLDRLGTARNNAADGAA